MRFKIRPKKYSKSPQGTLILNKQFAWFPLRVQDHWIWLEDYYQEYVCIHSFVGGRELWVQTDHEWCPNSWFNSNSKTLGVK